MEIYAKYIGNGFIVGIPARDLTRGEFEALDADQQYAVTHSGLYEVQEKPVTPAESVGVKAKSKKIETESE